MPLTAPRLPASTVRPPTTATMPTGTPMRMPVPEATETLDSAPMLLSTNTDPRTPTTDSALLLTNPPRSTVAATDTPRALLTLTHTVPSPLRPTVMPLTRTVPVATNSEELLLPLPTRLDTRRTSTESGVASTAPRSDTESLAPRPMRLTPTVVVPLRTTVHALLLLPTAPTHGAVPAVTGERPLLVSRVPALTPVASPTAPPRDTPTLVTNPTPTLTPMPETRASPTPLVATVTPLLATPVTDHSVMPPLVASVTNGPA